MRHTLELHPDSRSAAVTRFDVEIARTRPSQLELRYELAGRIEGVRLPDPLKPQRGDALWQHTCFEVFLRASEDDAYYEFNFAPTLEWAAYRFTRYRENMQAVLEMSAPHLDTETSDEVFRLWASLALDGLPNLPVAADWSAAVSAVIEEANGDKSYWALAHPPGKPDFHHADGFVHELKAHR